MRDIEIPTFEDIYNISLLVKNGWKLIFDDNWEHPEKLKYTPKDKWDYKGDERPSQDYWPYEDALEELNK
jgi:hypothetical protein